MAGLCDTNILGELSRPTPNPGVLAWGRSITRVTLSAVTVEEIQYGLAWKPNSRISEWFERFSEDFCDVVPVTQEIAAHAGRLRGAFQAKGISRTQADMMIAATAALHGLTLVTRNTQDFEGCNLRLMNPFAPR
ncbi:MAG: type II toxin-antitoxin system VapC family toxin [Nitrococcus sp.]|nr:type II toxin-antitoxin system VapC family toxin [Nitrococcus sp.]